MFPDVPKEYDDFFFYQFLIIFLIGFLINVFSNGTATLIFLEKEYDIYPNSSLDPYYLPEKERILQEYGQSITFRNKVALYVSQILYWIISPLLNFYFFFFVKKDTISK